MSVSLRKSLAAPTRPAPRGEGPLAVTDGELLVLFTQHNDAAAFETLLDRHGAMVWRVCRQLLRREHDAEDAFQATFLLLVKSARQIGASGSAAGWLFRVAYRTSLHARRRLASRREEALALDPTAPPEEEFPDLTSRHYAGLLAEELRRLPEKYQTPLVMRYLQGQSRRAIAEATDSTIQAVQGRLARGKQLLRRRLVRRGVTLASAMAAISANKANTSQAAIAAPSYVVLQTSSNATALAAGGSLAASVAVTSLLQQGTRAMLLASMTKPLAAAAACGLAAIVLAAPPAEPTRTTGEGVVLSVAVDAEEPESPTATLQLAAGESPKEGEPEALATGAEAASGLSPVETTTPSPLGKTYTRHPGVVWSGPDADANAKVISFLEEPLEDSYEGTLEGLLEHLRMMCDLACFIDQKALDELGMTPDEPVVFDPQGLTVRAALEMTLDPLELVATAHRGALCVTTQEEELTQVVVALYPVGDIVTNDDGKELVETIQAMVANDTWAVNGGGEAEAKLLSTGTLAISQTQRVHGEIAALLESLRKVQTSTRGGVGKPRIGSAGPAKERGLAPATTLLQKATNRLIEVPIPRVPPIEVRIPAPPQPPVSLVALLVTDPGGPKLDPVAAQQLVEQTGAERLGLSLGQAQRAVRIFKSLRDNTALQTNDSGPTRDAKLFRTAAGGAWSDPTIEPSEPPTKELDPQVLIDALQQGLARMQARAEAAKAQGDEKAHRDAMEIVRRTEDEIKRKIEERRVEPAEKNP